MNPSISHKKSFVLSNCALVMQVIVKHFFSSSRRDNSLIPILGKHPSWDKWELCLMPA
jgi:hypothetical protein